MRDSLGRRLLELPSSEIEVLERQVVSGEGFTRLDAVSGRLLGMSLAGQRVGSLTLRKQGNQLTLDCLASEDREFLEEQFLPERQQGRGAWYIPEAATIKLGLGNLPHYYAEHTRFASGLVADEAARVPLAEQPAALYFWTVLQPLLEFIYRPILFRTTDPPAGTSEEQRQAWQDLEADYAAIGLETGLLNRCHYGSGWSRLGADERLELRTELLRSLRDKVTARTGSLHRILVLRQLVERYYSRAKRAPPTMRQVLNKQLQPILTGYFGGDWLAFLRYIGEQPEAEERITTALPEPKLYVQAEDRASAVAAQHGVSPDEIRRMLASFWSQEASGSPVRPRAKVLREYWRQFEEIHSRQEPGMPPLWGFVEDDTTARFDNTDGLGNGPPWYAPGTYKQLLSATLLSEVDTLWGGTFLLKWPDRIASSALPHGLMASAFGPSLHFWHGLSLTSWFASEGPYSKTEITGLQAFYATDLAQLAEVGCPVDDQLFRALKAAEKKLGRPTRFIDPRSKGKRDGMDLEFGSRRAGFEYLRDVITSYRREWTGRYIDAYIESRWNAELRDTATEYYKLAELKGRVPKAKEFAGTMEAPTNHWFGGNACDLYAAFGARAPFQCTRRRRLLPWDIQAFMRAVFKHLGGKNASYSELATAGLTTGNDAWRGEWQTNSERKRLAEFSVSYVQLWEVLGRVPELAEFGRSKVVKLATAAQLGPDEVWVSYSQAVQLALRQFDATVESVSQVGQG